MPRMVTGVECAHCGLTTGNVEAGGPPRCGDCGRFAERSNDYCAEHDTNIRAISGWSACPMCREKERVEAMRHEQMARRADPNMHNSVDAQANAIDHSRRPGP